MTMQNRYLRHTFILYFLAVMFIILTTGVFQFLNLRQASTIHLAASLDLELAKADRLFEIVDQLIDYLDQIDAKALAQQSIQADLNRLRARASDPRAEPFFKLTEELVDGKLNEGALKLVVARLRMARSALGESVGSETLAARAKLDQLYRDLDRKRMQPFLLSIGLSILLAFFLGFAGRSAYRRLRSFVEEMGRLTTAVAQGVTNIRGRLEGDDEFHQVVTAFNSMLDRVEVVQERLRRSNQDLESFAYLISHDLQTPMRHIMHFAQDIKESSGAQESAHAIELSASKLMTLVTSLLEFSRVSPDGLLPSPVDVRDLVLGSARELGVATKNIEIDETLQTVVWGYSSLLGMLVQNLMQNAIKYGGRNVQIRVWRKEIENGSEIFFADNGPGIPKDQRERVFQLFRRLDREIDTPGHGIGLALCRRIAEWHAGEINIVDSEIGTVFKLSLRIPRG